MEEINPFFRNVAMYLRKSRAEEGESTEVVLARHKARLTKYAFDYKVNVVHIYEEVVSGDSLFARPHMVELLHAVEDGKYTGVLCMDIDRLGRGNMKEQGLILETFKDAQTAIITPDKVYNLNDEIDETATEFKTFMARQELKIIKKRLNRGRQMTIEKGGYVSNPPFGYMRAYQGKVPTLAPNPQEAEYVKMIFQWYCEDGLGCPTISHKLSDMGVMPHRGKEFSRNSIRKILVNPVYIGKVVWGQRKHIRPKKAGEKNVTISMPRDKWMIIDGLHSPIIDKKIFEKAGKILSERYHPPYMYPDKIVNPLAGLLYCQQCNFTMTLRTFGHRKYQSNHILCATKGCVKSSRADYVEKFFIHELGEKLHNLEMEQQNKESTVETQSMQIVLEKMKSEHSKLLKQRERLYDFLEQGVYTVAVFTEREQRISSRIAELIKEIEETESRLDKKKKQVEVLIPRIRYVLQEYWSASPIKKNQLLKSVVERAFYFKAKDAAPHDFTIDIHLRIDPLV